MQTSGQSTRTFGDMLKANLSAQAITAGLSKIAQSAKDFGNYLMGGVKSAASFGREMSAMSEKTGISSEVLQKFSMAAKMTEVDVETFTKSYSKSIKSMSKVDFDAKSLNAISRAYKTLGVEVRDSNGNLRDAQTVFWETIDSLKNVGNETERNAISMQIFGKSAMELNPIIKRGSEGFNELTKNMATFDDATMDSLRSLDISMQKFGGVMDSIKRSIGVAFAPMMKEIADSAANAGGKLRALFTAIAKGEDQEAINKKFEEFKNSIIELSEKIREQMPLFIDIGGKIISALWEGLKTAFEPILPQIVGWGALIAGAIIGWQALVSGAVAALAPIITAAFSAIGPLIAAAVAAWPVTLAIALAGLLTYLVVKFWPQIQEWATNFWNDLTKFFSEHWQDMLLWIVSWPVALVKTLGDMGVWEKIGEWLGSLWNNITTFLSEHWQDMLLWIVSWPVALVKTLNDIGVWEKIGEWLGGIWDNIKNWFSGLCQKTASWGAEMWNGFIDFLSNLPEKIGYWLGFALGSIVKFFKNVIEGLIQFGKNAWRFVTVEIPKIINGIIDWFAKLPGKIGQWLTNTIKKVKDWGIETGRKAEETGRNFLNSVVNFFKDLPGKIGKFLSDTVEGIKRWASEMVNKGREMAVNMSEAIVKNIKELPGKVYNLGKSIIEGIWNGIHDMIGWISNKVRSFCGSFLGGFKKALGINSPSRLFKEQIGKNLALGIGEGFSNEMKNVVKNMKQAIPDDLDMDFKSDDVKNNLMSTQDSSYTPTSVYDVDDMISAFQTALKGMAFKIDGDKIGELVVSKVERVVFA